MTTARWETWWALAGPKLPHKAVKIEPWGIIIAPLTDEEFKNIKSFRAPSPSLSASTDTIITHYPPRDEVQSRFKMIIEVTATSEDEAITLSRSVSDQITSALNLLIAGHSYAAELRKYRKTGNIKEVSAYSETITISPRSEPDDLNVSDLRRVIRLMKCIENNSDASLSYAHLLIAWRLNQTAGSKPLKRAILHSYVLAIETIVNAVVAPIRKAELDKIRLEERSFAAKFAEELPSRADKPKAIREASTKLREISFTNTLPAIERAASEIGINSDTMNQAKSLYRLRSQGLSHPGRIEENAINDWLKPDKHGRPNKADLVAREFLTRFCATR